MQESIVFRRGQVIVFFHNVDLLLADGSKVVLFLTLGAKFCHTLGNRICLCDASCRKIYNQSAWRSVCPAQCWCDIEIDAAAVQARSQVLRFGGAQYIFRGAIFLFYFMFKTNFFVNFQRLTGQHIDSCLFSVWSHKICDCMLCAVGSQAGEEDAGVFLKFSKTMSFSGKKYPHKTKNICLVMRFSPETTKKTNMKKNSPLLQDIFLTTCQCLMPVCRLWFSKNFVWCLPNALLTYSKNIIFWHKQQNWTNFIRISI